MTEADNSSESTGTPPEGATKPPAPHSALSDIAPGNDDTTPSREPLGSLVAGLNGASTANGHHPADGEPAAALGPAVQPGDEAPADGEPDTPGVVAGARQRVGPAVATVLDKVGPAVAKVGPAVATAREKIAPAVARIGPAVSTAKGMVGPAVSTAKDKVAPAVASAREKVTPQVAAATERTRSAAGRVRSQAGEHPWVATAAERAAAVASSGKTARELGQEVRRHPAVAGGAGAALAAAVGTVWLRLRLRSRRRPDA
ncbi:hypothetical protein [Pseudofrankia sp. DC12]|uniref:hypothetical protein n=1 Tax=Pseudofrankia sp. DC12 TaxID=683315 RepID=UPI00069918F0|nr:hypothetical protein [Pseudofrankia sp. DC12]